MIGTEKSLTQKSHSPSNPEQDTIRIDIGTPFSQKAQQPTSSLFFPLRNFPPQNINFTGVASIMQILEKRPELRDAVMKEYFRIQIANIFKPKIILRRP
jgi:hypothetical protein